MARKRTRRSSSNFLSIPFLAGSLFVLLIAGFLTMNVISNSTDVKSAKDFRPNLKELKNSSATRTAKIKSCLKESRVTSFVLEGTCNNREKDGFSKATYTCQDGTSGTIEKECLGPAVAFAQAKKACAKSVCPTPSPKTTTAQ
jgi:hypothetical protein